MVSENISTPLTKTPKIKIDYDLLEFDREITPSFKGTPDTIIDLETGDIQPKKLSGPDELLFKFIQHTKKNKPKNNKIIKTFSSDSNCLDPELITFDINDDEMVLKESKPGSAYLKLKKVLEEKIAKKRKEQHLQKMKNLDIDNEIAMEEYSDCGADDNDDDNDQNEEEDDDENNPEPLENDLIDNEVEEIQEENDPPEDENDDSDESSENDEENNQTIKKSRILTAFEDSDDDLEKNEFLDKSIDIPENKRNEQPIDDILIGNDDELNKNDEENELLELCSGRFTVTQKTQPSENLFSSTQLDTQVDPNELMAMCSGTFETQNTITTVTDDKIDSSLQENDYQTKFLLESSDEDENAENSIKQKKKSNKRRNFNVDDEDDEDEIEEKNDDEINEDKEEEEEEESEDDDEEVEKYIDYDSDENEVEVVMTKNDRIMKASDFVENEAELSGSEWGSADEDEADLGDYDHIDLDEENFNESKLQTELGQIHM